MAKKSKKVGKKGSIIMAEAKKIRKANPSLKWTDCVSKAGKKLKGKL